MLQPHLLEPDGARDDTPEHLSRHLVCALGALTRTWDLLSGRNDAIRDHGHGCIHPCKLSLVM